MTAAAPDVTAAELAGRAGTGAATLTLDGVSKWYDDVLAVDSFRLEVATGELVSLLGPSGCGKTTTLRMIAGFLEPDAGRIVIGDRDVTDVPANRRDIGMVFQSYGLFPHMTVEANVAYGLKMRGVTRRERRRRAAEALELVHLGETMGRYPRQLSGGQQQRVALARAIVIRPSVLLLDEPLSNLDASMRDEMRWEIRRLQRELGITTVVVTHDQDEALAMADRVVVMNGGAIEQIGTPHEIYSEPATLFVAAFIGECNFWQGTLVAADGGHAVFEALTSLRMTVADAYGHACGASVMVGLRPETIFIRPRDEPPPATASTAFPGVVEEVVYLGATSLFRVRLDDGTALRVARQNARRETVDALLAVGRNVTVAWEPSSARVLRSAA